MKPPAPTQPGESRFLGSQRCEPFWSTFWVPSQYRDVSPEPCPSTAWGFPKALRGTLLSSSLENVPQTVATGRGLEKGCPRLSMAGKRVDLGPEVEQVPQGHREVTPCG